MVWFKILIINILSNHQFLIFSVPQLNRNFCSRLRIRISTCIMGITQIRLQNFTVFRELILQPSPGINVFIGANGTGKTHLLKAAYAACDVSKTNNHLAEKLIRVFLPSRRALGRLVKRQQGSSRGLLEVVRGGLRLKISFSNHATVAESAAVTGEREWKESPLESVFIPVKEMLANAPGFRSLYAQREIHFEEIYADIIDRAFLPVRRGPIETPRRRLLRQLQSIMEGRVLIKNEEAFLSNRQGRLEFTLLAEGLRKLGLLWLLIQNGTLLAGSVLFWDEPGANLNPKLYGPLVEILLELQRMGVQVFLATHDYVLLKEIDLRMRDKDQVLFHSLFRTEEDGEIACHSSGSYLKIHPNAIADTFAELYDREIERSLQTLRR